MPEGPELFIQSSKLRKYVKNKKLESIQYLSDRKKIVGYHEKLLPLKITDVFSRGKKIIVNLDHKFYIVISLGLTGEIVLNKEVGDGSERHQEKHFVFKFNVSDNKDFYYSDVIRYGNIKIYDENDYVKAMQKIGPDVLQDNISPSEWYDKFEKYSKWNICKFLMDQSKFSGIGNHYKAEILYHAKICPSAHIKDLDESIIKKLLPISRKVLENAVEHIKNNTKRSGDEVYERDEDTHGNTVSKLKTPDGRTTYYCKDVQTIGCQM